MKKSLATKYYTCQTGSYLLFFCVRKKDNYEDLESRKIIQIIGFGRNYDGPIVIRLSLLDYRCKLCRIT